MNTSFSVGDYNVIHRQNDVIAKDNQYTIKLNDEIAIQNDSSIIYTIPLTIQEYHKLFLNSNQVED